MQELARFWRLFPKLAVGGSAVIVLIVGLYGVDALYAIAAAFAGLARSETSEGLQVVVALIAIGVAAKAGAILASGLASSLGWLGRRALRPLLSSRLPADSAAMDILSTIEELVKTTLHGSKSYYLAFYKLKSMADEKLDQENLVSTFYAQVAQHLDTLEDWNLVRVQTYVGSMSQDQRKMELMEDGLNFLGAFAVVALAGALVLPLRLTFEGGWAVALVCTLAAAGAVLELARQKRFLARFVAGSYLENFTVAGISDYDEREGEERV